MGLDGTEVKDETGKIISLKDICIQALLVNDSKEELSSTEKMKRFTLAQLIFKNTVADITAEDIVMLKNVIGKYMSTLVVGLTFPLIEPTEKK